MTSPLPFLSHNLYHHITLPQSLNYTQSQEIGARDWMAENGLDICEHCMVNFRNTLFVPCHHTCCNECMTKLRSESVKKADKGAKCVPYLFLPTSPPPCPF